MGRNFNGGTDQVHWETETTPLALGAIAFRLRTTQATANVALGTFWNGSSRNGFGVLLNAAANKLTVQAYGTTATLRVNLSTMTSVNDGNEHHFVLNFNCTNGQSNQIYLNGTQEASGNSSATWSDATINRWIQFGDNADTFWASYVGDVWDIAMWSRQLDQAEVTSLANDYSPHLVAQDSLWFHAPLVRDWRAIAGELDLANTAITGTTVIEQVRTIGGRT